ncbi:MAG: Crp/Fnr family transcriptional regulator [Deltaproteobacteria bacterium]|jgi:CRP-like cAMP-binding protein|nr:Crp/Fnr family transcriptional regulator [Deltaproteobacteria bacterium]
MPDQSLAERFGVSLPEGTTVFRQGDPGGSVYVIRSGRVRVLKDSAGRQRMVTTLGPGDFFGEMAVVTGRPRSATVEVIEDAELLKVPAGTLEEMVAGTGEVAIRLIQHLAERLEHANRFIDLLLEDDITARVILAIQETLDGAEGAAAPDITDRDLALQLGLSKNDVRAGLRRLTRVGVLEVSSGYVLVKDQQRLAEFLDFIRNSRKA